MDKKISDEEFARLWNSATSVAGAAEAIGMSKGYASQRAVRMRAAGFDLKRFSVRGCRPESLSDQAARVAHDERISYREAGSRFGVTGQAVQQSYALLYPDDARPGWSGDATARGVVVELSRSGMPDDEVASEVGFSACYVRKIRLGVGGINLSARKAAVVEAAVAAVRAGTPAPRAAADHAVAYNTVRRRCHEAGVPLNGRTGSRDGSSVAAADLVERDGLSVAEASRRTGCAPPSVHVVLKRRRLARAP